MKEAENSGPEGLSLRAKAKLDLARFLFGDKGASCLFSREMRLAQA